MATIGDVATAISLIGKVIKAATDAKMMKKEFKELADYLKVVGRHLEMLDDRELGDASMQTFQKMEEVLLQCHDLADNCQQRSSFYLMVKGKRIQNELRGAQEKIRNYLTLIPLIHFTQVFRRFKEEETNKNENCQKHDRDESYIPGLVVEKIVKSTDNSFQSNAHSFTDEQMAAQCTKLLPMLDSEKGSIIRNFIMLCKRPFSRHEPMTSPVTSMSYGINSFTYKQIVKMTFNFKIIIGRGGFGKIYYGLLKDGTDVAIKLQASSSQHGDTEFLAELRSLTRVHHTNLISLIGYCEDESNLAIVYEYMPQGNLQDNLRGIAGFPVLTWAQRLQIAYQVAQGLDYLHTGCNPPIVHRDVKSANILLGENLEAKITDFGISMDWNENDTDTTTEVVGTFGYLDPEYYQTCRVSTAVDVYGFGITLLEMITGRPPRDPNETQSHIVEWIALRIASGADFVDGRLNEYYGSNSMRKVVQLALSCIKSSASMRPRMAEVAIQLKEVIEMKPFKQKTEVMDSEDMENEDVEEALHLDMKNEDVEEALPQDMENEEVEEAFVTSIAQADRPECMHQLPANLFTSWTLNAPGRRFWGCKNWKMASDCGYFKWHDPVRESVAIEEMDFVIHQRDELDEQIKMMDEMMSAMPFINLKALDEKIVECKRSKEALEMKWAWIYFTTVGKLH